MSRHIERDAEVELAAAALPAVRRVIARAEPGRPVAVSVEGSAGPVKIPRGAMDLLSTILTKMSAGQSVSIVSRHAELTTSQAAELLNVSRPHLVKLLERGDIEFTKVGTHRRVRAESLIEFQHRSQLEQRQKLDELIGLSQEDDLGPDPR